jgi:hypothetical protein
MAVEVTGLDTELLKAEIKKTYARVSERPEEDFIFPTGRGWALDLGYPPHGFERIETGDLVETYARSKFEDTRRKAEKFGARGTTVKAYKPRR